MSSWTFGVAVAVSAMMGISAILSIIERMLRYSGRKSCPHSDMQCASSMAQNDMGTVFKKSVYSSLVSDSGATYSSFVIPARMSAFTCSTSPFVSEEFSTCATEDSVDMPRMASTWFFIRAISGEMMMAVPSISNAGNW